MKLGKFLAEVSKRPDGLTAQLAKRALGDQQYPEFLKDLKVMNLAMKCFMLMFMSIVALGVVAHTNEYHEFDGVFVIFVLITAFSAAIAALSAGNMYAGLGSALAILNKHLSMERMSSLESVKRGLEGALKNLLLDAKELGTLARTCSDVKNTEKYTKEAHWASGMALAVRSARIYFKLE